MVENMKCLSTPGRLGLGTVALWLLLASTALAADFEESGDRWWGTLAQSNFDHQPRFDLSEPLGAEAFSAETHSPRIPEPMVFDLVRPLGARKGELEINTLAIIPLNRRAAPSGIPDAIGLPGRNRPRPEWAPEIEYAISDGFAVEFELPFEDDRLEAYKGAVQYTFGTAFDNRFIHGTQGIMLYDRTENTWSPTLLYLFGLRIDERWSFLGMCGVRTEISDREPGERTERLFNLSIFYDMNEQTTVGLESNYSHSLSGAADLLLMPQVHWEITDYWMLQYGAGLNFSQDRTLPEVALRLIRSY